jgi:hypothetical protein
MVLPANNLVGTMPASLRLAQLGQLDLIDNQLEGSLSFLAGLTQLTWVAVQGNRLSGTIPAALVELPKLAILSLYGNRLTGLVPKLNWITYQAEGYCCLEGYQYKGQKRNATNQFACPLPAGADTCSGFANHRCKLTCT